MNKQDKKNNVKSMLGGAVIVSSDGSVLINDDQLCNAVRLVDDFAYMACTVLNECSTDELARSVASVSNLITYYNKHVKGNRRNAFIVAGLLMLLHNLSSNLMNRYDDEENGDDGDNNDDGEGNDDEDTDGNILLNDGDNPFE